MPISAEAPWLNYYGAIPRTLNYPRLTIYQLVAQTARECPDLPAYEFMGRRTSYRNFLARIDRAALALYTAGIRAGDRVTICMPNTPQALDCFYALNRIGAVSNMIHPLSAEEEIRFYLDVSGSQAILTLDRFYGKVAAAAARAKRKPKLWIARLQPELKPLMRLGYNLTQGRKTPKLPQEGCTLWTDLLRKAAGTLPPDDGQCDACASILYSGGTTGTTKGICLSSYNFNALALQTIAASGYESIRGCTMLSVMPVFSSAEPAASSCRISTSGPMPTCCAKSTRTSSPACRRCSKRCCARPGWKSSTCRSSWAYSPAATRCPWS